MLPGRFHAPEMFEGLELRARDDTVQSACTYEPYGAFISVKLTCADSSSGSTKTEKEHVLSNVRTRTKSLPGTVVPVVQNNKQ